MAVDRTRCTSACSFPAVQGHLHCPGQGRGQESFSRSLVLEGLTVCPSCQDLPDPVHDAAEVQLPHGGSAFHDETGEESSPARRAEAPPSLEHSSCRPSLSWAAFLTVLSLPGLWEPCEGRTILASALRPGLIQ